jgi:hypothetical protein
VAAGSVRVGVAPRFSVTARIGAGHLHLEHGGEGGPEVADVVVEGVRVATLRFGKSVIFVNKGEHAVLEGRKGVGHVSELLFCGKGRSGKVEGNLLDDIAKTTARLCGLLLAVLVPLELHMLLVLHILAPQMLLEPRVLQLHKLLGPRMPHWLHLSLSPLRTAIWRSVGSCSWYSGSVCGCSNRHRTWLSEVWQVAIY